MIRSPFSLGIMLYAITMLIFFTVYFFFSGIEYFETTLVTNAFILPIIYALAAFASVKLYWNSHKTVTFKEAFKKAFIPMFIGGIFSIFSIFIFLNFVDTDAKKLLNYQYVERQRTELDSEYTNAKKMLKEPEDIADLEKKYAERKESFTPERIQGKDMLTASHFSGYFAAILIFYLVLSLFFGAFFRTRSVHQ